MGAACMLVLGSQMGEEAHGYLTLGGEEKVWALASIFPVCPRRPDLGAKS